MRVLTPGAMLYIIYASGHSYITSSTTPTTTITTTISTDSAATADDAAKDVIISLTASAVISGLRLVLLRLRIMIFMINNDNATYDNDKNASTVIIVLKTITQRNRDNCILNI